MIRTVSVRQLFTLLCLALVGIVLAGCPGSSSLEKSSGQGEFQSTGGDKPIGGAAAASAQRIFAENASLNGGEAGKDYKIAPLDVIEVTVFGVEDLNRTVQVASSGVITLPLINQVRAQGKTQEQLEQEIARKLAANYLQAPQVSVFIKEYNSQRITVEGAVKKPGIYPIKGQLSLLQAVALAEGLTEFADTSGIIVFRTVESKRLAARFDLKLVRSGKIDDPMLKAGDVVMVDESSTKTMLREVKSALPLTGLFQLLLL